MTKFKLKEGDYFFCNSNSYRRFLVGYINKVYKNDINVFIVGERKKTYHDIEGKLFFLNEKRKKNSFGKIKKIGKTTVLQMLYERFKSLK